MKSTVRGLTLCLLALLGCAPKHDVATGPSRSELFDLRTKCSNLAREFERDYRARDQGQGGALIGFTNHYDATQNRCYVEESGFYNSSGISTRVRNVSDAQEKHVLIGCSQIITTQKMGTIACDADGSPKLSTTEAKVRMDKLMDEKGDWPE